jgi:F-type H+-transporting ATPase subunit delta
MQNPRLANRYAKSLIDVAVEKNLLEQICADMKLLIAMIKSSKEFYNLLKSPIVKADKKIAIINAVTDGKINAVTTLFNKLLVNKGRESELLDIAEAFVEQYNAIKGIHKVTLTTAIEISADVKATLENKIKAEQGIGLVELETKVDESLIGGFVLEFNNNLVDASIARDLRDVKKQFAKNIYVSEL